MLSVPGGKSLAENTSHSTQLLSYPCYQEELDSGPLVPVLLVREDLLQWRRDKCLGECRG